MCIMSVENNIEQKSTTNENALINKKYSSPTIRLTLTLREPDEESCSVFNYISLITEEKRKRRRENEENQLNESVEEPEEGEKNEIKRIAQHFEEKYGGVNAKKRKKKRAPKFYNYTDLAAGYDESDSFIDNSEAFDEALPDDMETAFGGYYVNTGQLELKKVEIVDETSDLDEIRVGKRKICALKSDDDSSSDGDIGPSDDNNAKTEDEDVESVSKKLPDETNLEEVEPSEPPECGIELTKSVALKDRVNDTVKMNGDLTIKKKKKYKKLRAAEENRDELPKQKKKAATVKSMLEEKRIVENGDSTTNEPSKLAENTLSSINDVIESVVNAARNHSEDSRDSTSSNSDTKSIDSRSSYETEKGSHTDELATVESVNAVSNSSKTSNSESVKLPDNTDPEVLDLITQIRKCVSDSEASGARSLFKLSVNSKSSVNSRLLKFESHVRSMKSASRHALYEYLAQFLPCSKDTLMKRAKKLLIEEEERHVMEPLQKLKASIDKSMPALLDKYTAAVQRVAEEKCMNDLKNGEVDEQKIIASKMPPKKFIWTEELRRYLRELASCREKCFQTLKPRKESSSEYVKRFMETKVKPLWPTGWMETSILMKEAYSTPKAKKISSACTVNGSAADIDSVPTSTTAAMMTTATTTMTSVKKQQSESPVPNSVSNVHSASGANAVNYSFLANSLTLPSLAVQQPTQTDSIYSSAPSAGIPPYRPDLNLLRSLPTNVPLSMEMLAQFTQLAPRPLPTISTPSTYSKSVSPPKKSTTPTPPFSTSRSTTPVSSAPSVSSSASSSSYHDKKKSADTSSSKMNEMFKIDSLIQTNSKMKKEHHILNHISQYNKHYSHKTEKRKNNSKKDVQVPNKGVASHDSASVSTNGGRVNSKTTSPAVAKGSNATTESSRKSRSKDLVLDLSPNKVKENKCDKTDHQVNSVTEAPPAPSSSVTAKDHNYWAREEVKEETVQDLQSQPRTSFSSPESNSSFNSSKTTHISRKQRILQESAKSMAQASPDSFSTSLVVPSDSASRRSDSHFISNLVSGKCEDKLLTLNEKRGREETTTATDFISQIINDAIIKKPFVYEHTKKESELKAEERVTCPSDFNPRPPSKEATDFINQIINDAIVKKPLVYEHTKKEGELKSEERVISPADFNPRPPSKEATDFLNLIINDAMIKKPLVYEHTKKESELKSEERVISPADFNPRPSSRDSLSSVGSVNAERKTPNNETADIIRDLVELNQIGGHSIPRRMDYHDSKKHNELSNGSMMSQSSLHLSDKNKSSSSLPRMTISPFQHEFFKHLRKSTNGGSSSYITNSKSQDNCFTSELPSLEVDRSMLNRTSNASKQENMTVFNYPQSVIMPPASARWYSPESKS